MTDTAMVPRKPEGREPARPALIDEQLADQLLGKAQAEGVELLDSDGLLSRVTRAVLERALAEEMTGHLGYEKHDPAGRGVGEQPQRLDGRVPHAIATSRAALPCAHPLAARRVHKVLAATLTRLPRFFSTCLSRRRR
jgi:hypothetical protein